MRRGAAEREQGDETEFKPRVSVTSLMQPNALDNTISITNDIRS